MTQQHFDKFYKKGHILTFIFALCLIGSTLQKLIPPVQSPDEGGHLYISYLLSKGRFALFGENGKRGGGNIDNGFIKYVVSFGNIPFHPEVHYTKNLEEASETISWAGEETFTSAKLLAYYFPLSYLPQATGLLLGRALSYSPAEACRLARLAALCATLLITYAALSSFHISPVSALCMALPMSIFQSATSSPDGINFALCLLILSLYLKAKAQQELDKKNILLLCVAIFTVTTHRLNMYPLAALPALLYFSGHKNNKLIFISAILFICITAWILLAMFMLPAHHNNYQMSDVIKYYATHPLETFAIFYSTLKHNFIFFIKSFIGILGWLDTPLPLLFYKLLCPLFFIIALLTFRPRMGVLYASMLSG